MMSPVAPRVVNDVSYVRSINHEGHLFGEVGWSHLLLRAMQMTFHIICVTHRIVTFRGRHRIWSCWSVTFSWQAQYSVKFG